MTKEYKGKLVIRKKKARSEAGKQKNKKTTTMQSSLYIHKLNTYTYKPGCYIILQLLSVLYSVLLPILVMFKTPMHKKKIVKPAFQKFWS